MAEKLLDKASYSLVRTNPKLTGNVKVVSDGTDIYLESRCFAQRCNFLISLIF